LHAKQLRKDTDIPYISHLISVAGIVVESGGSRDQAIAALLHDSIEDQAESFPGGAAGHRNEINSRFGAAVLEIVDGCTDTAISPKPPWRERKEQYLAHLKSAPSATRLVSCADKLHNARAILSDLRVMGSALWSRFNGGRDDTLWYYRELSNEFRRNGPAVLAEELDRVVTEIERLSSAG
jgi:(p)ppGpp synthase/HD superfamily hydrolase